MASRFSRLSLERDIDNLHDRVSLTFGERSPYPRDFGNQEIAMETRNYLCITAKIVILLNSSRKHVLALARPYYLYSKFDRNFG